MQIKNFYCYNLLQTDGAVRIFDVMTETGDILKRMAATLTLRLTTKGQNLKGRLAVECKTKNGSQIKRHYKLVCVIQFIIAGGAFLFIIQH